MMNQSNTSRGRIDAISVIRNTDLLHLNVNVVASFAQSIGTQIYITVSSTINLLNVRD